MKLVRGMIAISAVLGTLLVVACSGGNTGGQDDTSATVNDANFNDANAGSIGITLSKSSMTISEVSDFSVGVNNAAGAPVTNLRVVCDTESGISLIKPSTGAEMTDDFGVIDGRIGCVSPGTFRVGCRLAGGGNKRDFRTVSCTGETPTGFTGFAGAGGGGLGSGGSADSGAGEPGGTDITGTRITDIRTFDQGEFGGETAGNPFVDTNQDICDVGDVAVTTDDTYEPFFETILGVSVANESNQIVEFTRVRYRIPNADGSGTLFVSDELALVNNSGEVTGFTVTPSSSQQLWMLFTDAASGLKRFIGSSTTIPVALGPRTVTVQLIGKNDSGDSITVTGSTAISFGNFDNCNLG